MIHAILAILIIHLGVNLVGWSLAGEQPAVSTVVSAAITASDVTVPVSSASGYPSAGWLYIQGEALQYTAHETPCATGAFSGQPACFTGASRGQFETVAIAHPVTARAYNEASGALNSLATFESRTSINDLGNVTTPWGSGLAIVQFLGHAATWDWPMFDGSFAILRIFGAAITTAISLGIFYLLGTLLVSAVRTLRP